MHPLRVILFMSAGLGAAAAGAFGYLLYRASVPPLEAGILAAFVFGVFMIPWATAFGWAIRRASDLDLLIDRSRIAVTESGRPVHDRRYHGELDELARAIEEMRVVVEREKAWGAEQRATMQQIAAALGEGLLAISPRGRVVLANERIRDMFAVSGELTGRPLLEVVRQHSLVAAFERAVAGQPSSDRIAFGERQIEMRVFPVATSGEMAAVALFIDVTQIERLQRIRREFLDDFSHEVRTPLAGLRSAAEAFQGGGLTPAQEDQLHGVIDRQLARLERLVKDLSELNRIESGELVLEKQSFNLTKLLSELASDFSSRLDPARTAVDVIGTAVEVSADPLRVQQIFGNLLDNAWKYGGEKDRIEIECISDEGMAVVRVSDRGEGIPETDVNRIFQRFYRVDKSRSQTVPGVGLGLAITKHLVLLHGGTVRAYNRAGRGATFEVRLPAGA